MEEIGPTSPDLHDGTASRGGSLRAHARADSGRSLDAVTKESVGQAFGWRRVRSKVEGGLSSFDLIPSLPTALRSSRLNFRSPDRRVAVVASNFRSPPSHRCIVPSELQFVETQSCSRLIATSVRPSHRCGLPIVSYLRPITPLYSSERKFRSPDHTVIFIRTQVAFVRIQRCIRPNASSVRPITTLYSSDRKLHSSHHSVVFARCNVVFAGHNVVFAPTQRCYRPNDRCSQATNVP
jgi:hypothetical protein